MSLDEPVGGANTAPETSAGVTRRDAVRMGSGLAFGGLAASLLAACGSSGSSGGGGGSASQLKVGALLSLTGTFANIGRDQERGFQLWLAQHGNKIGGLPVKLTVEDDTGVPSVALQKAQRLLDSDNVDVTVGVIGSDVAQALRDTFNGRKKLLIVTNASTDSLTDKQFSRYIFRTSVTSFQQGYASGSYAVSKVGKKGVAVISDYAAGTEILASFKQALSDGGGEVVKVVSAPLGTTDWAPFLPGLRTPSDFVWAQPAGDDAVALVKQYQQFGLNKSTPLIGIGSLTTAESLPAEGDAALGIPTTYVYSANLPGKVNAAFVKVFRAKYHTDPSPYAMFAWDAFSVLDQAVAATHKNLDVEKMVPALENVKLDSPRGPISFDKTHQPTQRFYLFKVVNGSDGLDNKPESIVGVMGPTKQVSGPAPLPTT